MKHINLYIAASMLAISACTNEQVSDTTDDVLSPQEALPINIVTDEAAYTRATQAITINEGEKVYVFADKSSDGSEYFGAWELTSDGTGKLTSNVVKNYPTDGSTLDFYGIHGNFGDAIKSDVSFPSTAITHTIKTDQTQSADYCVSDLLYAVKKGVASSTDPITISFYHMLSKVEVALIPGDGFTSGDLNGAKVEILNTVNTVNFTPEKNIDMGGQTNRVGLLQVSGTTASDITMPTLVKESKEVEGYVEAVVVPQTLENKDFIRITLTNGNKYTVSSGETLKLESGKKYTYDLTIASYGITISSSITDWTSSETITGNAIKYIGDKMPEDAQIGDFYMNDGSLVSGSTDLTDEQKSACIGIVFQTDVNRIGNAEKEDLAGKKVKPHGLVMALKNVNNSAPLQFSVGNVDVEGITNTETLQECYDDINGLAHTNAIYSIDPKENLYPIFTAVKKFDVARPKDKTTEWFLPSVGQFWDLLINLGGAPTKDITSGYEDKGGGYHYWRINSNKVLDNINNILEKTNADKLGLGQNFDELWVAGEPNTDSWAYGRKMLFSNTDLHISSADKSKKSYKARPILAF